MLEMNNDTSSFLDEFEEEVKTDGVIDGEDDGVEIIESKNKSKVPEEGNDIKTITNLEDLDVDDSDKKDEDPKDKEESNENSFSYKAFLAHLSEEGLVEFEDKEDLEDTPDVVYESINKTIQNGINSYKESIPETGQKFLEYLEKGGDANKYIETLQKPLDINSLDLESESDQEKVTREYLKTQDYSSEEIDETITDYKENLLLDKQSKIAAKQLNKSFEKRTEKLLQEQEQIAESQKQDYINHINNISNTIDTSETLAGLTVAKTEKDSFRKYLLIKGKDGLTDYERELQTDPVKTQLELAYLKFKKYDFGAAKKQGESEASKKLNWSLKNNESTLKGGKSSQEIKQEDNLNAFRSFMGKQKN